MSKWRPWLDAKDRDCSWESPVDCDGVQVSSDLDARGRELPDPVPTAPPIGYSKGPSLADFVQRMIRQEVSMAAEANQMETFDEADDFDIEDDPLDPLTPYEEMFMPRAATPPADPPLNPLSDVPSPAQGTSNPGPAGEPLASPPAAVKSPSAATT